MPADCIHCTKANATNRCGGCKKVFYCNQQCQRNHWKKHKKQCKLWRKPRKSKQYQNDSLAIKDEQQLKSFIDKLKTSYVTMDQAAPETAHEENEIFDAHNKFIQQLFTVAKHIQLSSNFTPNQKHAHLQLICDTVYEYDGIMSKNFDEIPERLFTNNDGSVLMETSLKQSRPSESLICDIVRRIHSGAIDLNDEMKVMYYIMFKQLKTDEWHMVLRAISVAQQRLDLKYGIFGDKNNAKAAENEIQQIVEFIVTNVFTKDNDGKRPHEASKYVRFDTNYVSKQCFADKDILLLNGYTRDGSKNKHKFPQDIIELCIRYYCKNRLFYNVYRGELKFEEAYNGWSSDNYFMDCSDHLIALTGGSGWKNRQSKTTQYFFDESHKLTYLPSRVDTGFSTPGYITYCDNIHNRFWSSGDDRVKGSGVVDQNGYDTYSNDLSCEYVLELPSRYQSGRLFTTDTKIFVYTSGSFISWNLDELKQHQTDYCTTCCDDDDIPKVDEHGIETKLYSIFEQSSSEGDDEYEVSGGQTFHDSFEINTNNIGNKQFGASMLSIANNWNASSSTVYVTNQDCIYAYDMKKEDISGMFLGHNIGEPQLEFRQFAIDSHNMLISNDYRMVKIWDIRTLSPIISIRACGNNNLNSGIGFNAAGNVFIASGGLDEAVTIWDIRKRNKSKGGNGALYEISTGNTMVEQIVWHKQSQSLFVRTECMYIDRMGNRYYGDDYDVDYDEDDAVWPSKAHHRQDDFLVQYDAGSNNILRYRFQ